MGKTKKKYINTENEVSINRACKYIGSFAINMMKAEERQTLMNERLEELKNVKKGVPVVLQVTTSGIKVLDENEMTVKMAHAIMRVAFSTCSADSRLFSYVAKSTTSSQNPSILQAHVFKTKKGSHAQQLSQLVSKAFKLAFAMATVKRKNNLDEFESKAKAARQTSLEVKRRWAKKEIARGHEYSEHAERARRLNPLAMLPGPADPVDNEMLREDYSSRPRNVSNADFDNRRLAQGSQANVAPQESVSMGTPDRIVDAQVHQPVPPVAVIVTPPKQERAMSPVVEIQPDLMYQVASTDNDVANTAMIPEQGPVTAFESDVVQDIAPTTPEKTLRGTPQMHADTQQQNVPNNVGSNETSVRESQVWPDVPEFENDYERLNTQESLNTEQNVSEDLYVNYQVTNEILDNLYQPLVLPSADYPVETVTQASEQNGNTVHPGSNGVEEVADGKGKFQDESDEDELYLTVDDLNPDGGTLRPTDRTVLEDSYWYQPGLPRDIAEEMLGISMPGTFFIRESTSNPGAFALSIRIPRSVKDSGIANILIEHQANGDFKIPGFRNSFPSLPMLVAYYASFQDELPVKLRLTFDENTSTSNNNDVDDAYINESDASGAGVTDLKTPEEEAVAMIDAVLPSDPDYANYESCEPILNELNAQ